MTTKVRAILYLLFLGGFFITAPILVFYTAGYRFHFPSQQVFQTGVLSISSIPKNAQIFIDDAEHEKTTPTLIDTVFPGEHTIRISKDGYASWEKTLPINEFSTTFIQNIVLFHLSESEKIQTGVFESVTPSPQGQYFVFIKKEEPWFEVWIHNLHDNQDSLIQRLPTNQLNQIEISWSFNDNNLIFHEYRSDGDKYSVINPHGEEQVDLNAFISDIKRVEWSETQTDHLLIEAGELLYEFSVSQKDNKPLALNTVAVLNKNGKRFSINEGQQTELIQENDDGTEKTLAYLPTGSYLFKESLEPFVLIQDRNTKRAFLIDGRGDDQPILLNDVMIDTEWNPVAKNILLYATEFELHVYNTETHDDELITRLSKPVEAITWHPIGSNLLYASEGDIYAVELDRRDQRNRYLLSAFDSIDSLWVDKNGKSLYILGEKDEARGVFVKKIQD